MTGRLRPRPRLAPDRSMTTLDFDPDDPLLRPLTITQAMVLTGRSERTINRWIHDGRLRKVRLKDPPEDLLIEREVLEIERETRQAARRRRPRPKKADTPHEGDGVDAGG